MTTKIFWCLWLTLARPEDPFTCVPLQDIPEDYKHLVDCKIGERFYRVTEAERICREEILGNSMAEIYEVSVGLLESSLFLKLNKVETDIRRS